jgi:hypothetical protein
MIFFVVQQAGLRAVGGIATPTFLCQGYWELEARAALTVQVFSFVKQKNMADFYYQGF